MPVVASSIQYSEPKPTERSSPPVALVGLPWEPLPAVAWAVWATYPALAVFGLLHPLRWLPLMFFTIGYKAIWLVFVALPPWQAGTLDGSTQSIAGSFLGLPLLVLVVPWGYAWRTYVVGAPRA